MPKRLAKLHDGETRVLGAWTPVQRDAHVAETWFWVLETGSPEAFRAMRNAMPAGQRPKLGNYVAVAWHAYLGLRWWR